MNGALRVLCVVALTAPMFACSDGASASNLQVERLPDVRPNLPPVPTLPPPPYPVQYPDQSYSVYGVRKRIRNTMDTEVTLTGYIVEIYQAPECPEGHTCPPPRVPHLWMADAPNETDAAKRITLVGYAENQQQIDDAIAHRGQPQHSTDAEQAGILPIPTDFGIGAKIKVHAQFTRVSGTGFSESEGVLEYRGHETLQPAPGATPAPGGAAPPAQQEHPEG